MQAQPTAYPAVNAVLADFLAGVQAILGDHFIGMYLYGSLALGDFDPQGSDIDFIVVTDAALSREHFAALREMHARFSAGGSPWAKKIEAAYISQEVLQHTVPPEARYPQIEKGGTLAMEPLESGWMVQCYTLREHGVVVAGPHPHTLVALVGREQTRQAAAYAEVWLEQARHDPEWLAWLRRKENQAFVVLTLCRMLYTLDRGAVASKPAAARWARQTLGTRWAALIAGALEGQYSNAEAPDGDIAETVALVEYAVTRYWRQDATSPHGATRNGGNGSR